ncbi:helix-turn-helix transcriptional regulator [Azospirillum brasilense]|uniref:helix-turn-helix domain-containing protein n=2 Tax=Azospirillum brasilense TaxID=192 RepID=UPI0031F32116
MNVTKSAMSITPAQCRAARGLLNWSQDELAEATNGEVAKRSLVRFEKGDTAPQPRTLIAIRTAMEAAGVEFIPENGGGAGVRLRKADEGR